LVHAHLTHDDCDFLIAAVSSVAGWIFLKIYSGCFADLVEAVKFLIRHIWSPLPLPS
jgi:hypothetical protein